MNELVFLVYGILFLLLTGYFLLAKNKWGIFTLTVGVILILLYIFLPSKSNEDIPTPSKKITTTTITTDTKSDPVGVLPFFVIKETIQSPTLRNTFNYIEDPQKDGSSGKIEYASDKNMRRWGITTLYYTHVKFSNGKIFKLRNPNSSDSYGYFVDKYGNKLEQQPDNFFSDYIQLGTFS